MRCSDFYICTYMSNLKFIGLKLHYNNYAHALIKSPSNGTFPRITASQSYIVRLMHYSNVHMTSQLHIFWITITNLNSYLIYPSSNSKSSYSCEIKTGRSR